MSNIDTSIERGKRRRKLMVISSSFMLVMALSCYFAWLFLMQGFNILVKPQLAAQTQHFRITQGLGFALDNTVYTLGSSATLEVSADKFASKAVQLWQQSDANIEVELTPLPASLMLRTDKQLEDIRWQLDGKLQFKGSQFNTSLKPGLYQITASHPYYQAVSVPVEAQIAGQINQTLALEPIQGTLSIDSTPTGATVSVDGEILGQTPMVLPQAGGEYQVSLSAPGYQALTDKVQVTAAVPTPQRQYMLTPEQGLVTVTLQPLDGALLLDDNPVTNPISLVANKMHRISYDKAGFVAQSQTITLKPGQQKALSFALKPELGRVKFQANQEAQVYINGKRRGQTPLKLSLQTLPTKVEFRKPGYRTVSQSVTPQGQRSQLIDVAMLTEFDARRREGRALFIDTLGIEMNKIRGKAFAMGSPENEPYRNRNERQRQVSFSRQFWVSKHEITQDQYAAYAKFRGSKGQAKGKQPVSNISWSQAAQFCNWLSVQEGLMPFYLTTGQVVTGVNKHARGYRLPTEAEWEYIARLHRRSAVSKYIWGDQDYLKDNQGNFADKSLKGKQTFVLVDYQDNFTGKAPVGSFEQDRGGFYDLDGNVREWVHDRYALATAGNKQALMDYLGTSRGEDHVVKGASYKTGRMKNIRASVRTHESSAAEDIGFRIARYDN